MSAFERDPTEPVRAPSDQYDPWQPPERVDVFQRALILGAYPPGSEIVEVCSYRPGYIAYPYRVEVRQPGGETSACAIKASPLIGGIEREGSILPVLARLGLAAPALLAGPAGRWFKSRRPSGNRPDSDAEQSEISVRQDADVADEMVAQSLPLDSEEEPIPRLRLHFPPDQRTDSTRRIKRK